ncbi:MAG: hypothetical protein N4A35_10840 [Flavobacteriales bacterium]|jgi:hypothetical protein|nr:hypothetical protein [Flavobacteriales bacterium]
MGKHITITLVVLLSFSTLVKAQSGSKEKIYSSFIIVNDGLESTRSLLTQETSKLYFDLIKKQGKDSIIVQLSDSLRHKTAELVNYINRVKVLLIIKTEKLDKEAVVENDTIISLKHLEHFDDYYTPGETILGKNGEKKLKGKLSAYDLKKQIRSYEDFISKNCFRLINPPKYIDINNGGYYYNWEHSNFKEKPLAGIITYLSKMQLDITLTEHATLKHLIAIESE